MLNPLPSAPILVTACALAWADFRVTFDSPTPWPQNEHYAPLHIHGKPRAAVSELRW